MEGGAGGHHSAGAAGSSLVSQADTQAIVADIHRAAQPRVRKVKKGPVIRTRYEQSIDSGAVESKSDLDLGAADFETLKQSQYAYHPERRYYNGYSEGKDIYLYYRDEEGHKRRECIRDYPWYFWIRHEEKVTLQDDKWEWIKRRGYVKDLVRDEKFPAYWRVHVEKRHRRLADMDWKNQKLSIQIGERGHPLSFPRNRDAWTKLHHTINWLMRYDIEPLEADLSLKQRFMADVDLRILADYSMVFFDLETDDSIGGFERIERNRILSVAWECRPAPGEPFESHFLLLGEETDEAEADMLRQFLTRVKNHDILVAWNGGFFDFPMLIARSMKFKIRFDWRSILMSDHIPLFKRHYVRAGAAGASLSLDNIGERVLKMKKLDWRTEFRAKFPGVTPKVIELYRRDKELLERYNRRDVEILRRLEDFTGFGSLELTFQRIGNCFGNDFNISTKIDGLLLKKGYKEGHHFASRWRRPDPEQYAGGFVFTPRVGFHRNVAALDFKSLYPSMVKAFNISPETMVRAVDRVSHPEGTLCHCPVVEDVGPTGAKVVRGGSTFTLLRKGYISQMFDQTLEKRKKYTTLQDVRCREVGTTNDDLYLLYYRLAYSFKRLGLSFYGEMGNPRGRYYDTEMAEAITLAGQYFIKKTATYAAECGYEVLYGDTDSIYVQLAPNDEVFESEEARIRILVERGIKFTAVCQSHYEGILREHNCNLEWNAVELEFEDVFSSIFFVAKKRYAGRMLSHKGAATDTVEVKGLELMRSDYSAMTRDLQKAVLDAVLLEELTAEEIEERIIAPEYDRCAGHQLPVEAVTITKSISKDPEDYPIQTVHVKLAQYVKEEGREFFVGMKIEFIVVAIKPNLRGVLASEYDPEVEPYDAAYYWDRVIYPASMRVLEVVYPDHDWKRWLIDNRRRRDRLLERYRRWLLDPKRVDTVWDRVKVDVEKGNLGEAELGVLRASPRLRRLKRV